MNEFDYIKAFVDVDLLKVEAVGMVIGHVEAAIYKGMVEANLSDETARQIIREAHAELIRAVLAGTGRETPETEPKP